MKKKFIKLTTKANNDIYVCVKKISTITEVEGLGTILAVEGEKEYLNVKEFMYDILMEIE